KATRSLSGPIGAMVAVVLFLVAGVIATVRMGWLPKFGGKSSKSEASKSAFGPAPASTPTNVPAESNAINPRTNTPGVEKPPDFGGRTSSAATSTAVPPNVPVAGNKAKPSIKTEAPTKPEVEIPNEITAPSNVGTSALTEKRVVKKAPAGKTAAS